MPHQVFIERCRDENPETAKGLAQSLSQRYGIDPQQILSRLKRGRFRVKANLEIGAARSFMSFLETQGALCSIIDAKGEVVVRSAGLKETVRGRPIPTPVPAAAASPSQRDVAIAPTLPPTKDFVTPAPLSSDFNMALETPPPPADPGESGQYESGLSAAFGDSANSSQSLGALESGSAASSLTLSTLDGASGEATKAPAKARDAVTAAEAFLPPEMAKENALVLDVAAPEPAPAMVERASESSQALQAFNDVQIRKGPEATPALRPMPERILGRLSGSEHVRLAVGVFFGILISFVAVHLYASGQEESRYGEVRDALVAEYDAAQSPEAWEVLDDAKSHALSTLKERRQKIVVTSIFVWLLLIVLFVAGWLRLIDWSRWQHLSEEAESA